MIYAAFKKHIFAVIISLVLWINSVVVPLRWHSAHESETRMFSRKRSVSSISVTPRRNKSAEECAKKGHLSFQRSLRLLGLQPEDFGIDNKVNISDSRTSSYRYYE
jgi:hypothetical protein